MNDNLICKLVKYKLKRQLEDLLFLTNLYFQFMSGSTIIVRKHIAKHRNLNLRLPYI